MSAGVGLSSPDFVPWLLQTRLERCICTESRHILLKWNMDEPRAHARAAVAHALRTLEIRSTRDRRRLPALDDRRRVARALQGHTQERTP